MIVELGNIVDRSKCDTCENLADFYAIALISRHALLICVDCRNEYEKIFYGPIPILKIDNSSSSDSN